MFDMVDVAVKLTFDSIKAGRYKDQVWLLLLIKDQNEFKMGLD